MAMLTEVPLNSVGFYVSIEEAFLLEPPRLRTCSGIAVGVGTEGGCEGSGESRHISQRAGIVPGPFMSPRLNTRVDQPAIIDSLANDVHQSPRDQDHLLGLPSAEAFLNILDRESQLACRFLGHVRGNFDLASLLAVVLDDECDDVLDE